VVTRPAFFPIRPCTDQVTSREVPDVLRLSHEGEEDSQE
jgi:hypothetical protein